ncbi:hypothetical protein ACFWHR_02240 [Leucobacter sp. NPDC058333]|uniref:hypothetical protein n=1 Tax=Leucobacter sp. NPDC058333 TaxID=3346450 RepID=UPI003651A44D
MTSSSRLPHLVRGSSAASIATFAALLAHVAGGGALPGLVGIAAPLILSLLVCTLLAGRTLSLTRLSISVVLSQTLFHGLFVLGAQPGATGQAPPAGGAAHDHASMMLAVTSDGSGTATALAAQVQADPLMWGSHLIAALLTVAFLHRGERAIRWLHDLSQRMLAWLGLRSLTARLVPLGTVAPRSGIVRTPAWSVIGRIIATAQPRRGPPMAARLAP